MSELAEICAIMGVSPGDVDEASTGDLQQIIDDMEDPGAAPIPESPASPGCSALAEIVEMVLAEPSPKKYEHRSWETAKNSRKDLHIQQLQKRVDRLPGRDDQVLDVVVKTMYRIPGVKAALRQLGSKEVDYSDPAIRAWAVSLAAFAPTVKGHYQQRRAQAVAFASMARCALAQQQLFFENMYRTGMMMGGSTEDPAFEPGEVKVFSWQWDETSQRVKPMILRRLANERIPQKKATTQIMMQTGLLSIFEVVDGCSARVGSCEYLCRGLMLAEQS